jgi:tetratricopeptide (TPR) repeat protein
MKILGVLVCVFLLTAICVAEETEYFDWKGSKLYATKNYTDSLTYFNKAITQDPGYIDAWVHKGDTEKALKDYNVSIQSYNSALQIDGKKVAAWSGITEDYAAMKSYANASIAAAKATEFDNKTKANWLREGNLLQLRGMYNESTAKYDGALALDPQYKDALYKKGVSLMVLGRYAEQGRSLTRS